jgi:hypothetical protein
MRVFYAAALATVALLLVPPPSPAQSLADAAAKEKARRKAAQKGKSFTDDDLRGGGGGSVSTGTDPASGGSSSAKPGDTGKSTAKPKTEEEVKAEQSAAWRKRVEAANKKVPVLQETIDKIQLDLNDMSGGVYSSRRATLLSLLEDTKKQLAAAQQSVADLEDEGRKNLYR